MVSGRQLAPRPLMARCLAVPQSNTVADHACAPSHREIIVHAKAYSVSSPTTKPLASLLRTLPPECQDLCTADRPLSTLQRSFPSARRRPAHAPIRTLRPPTGRSARSAKRPFDRVCDPLARGRHAALFQCGAGSGWKMTTPLGGGFLATGEP